MTRVLLLLPSMVQTGGAERMVDSLSRLLASAGLEVHEASFDPAGARRSRQKLRRISERLGTWALMFTHLIS